MIVPDTEIKFGTPHSETKALCEELLRDLGLMPVSRFYASELAALIDARKGYYVIDQLLVDFLFDLRRVAQQDLEGSMVYDARLDSTGYGGFKQYKRPILQRSLLRHYEYSGGLAETNG